MPCLEDSRALFCFSQENPVRKAATTIANSKPFFIIILVTILMNSVALAINQPKYPAPEWAESILWYLEVAFTAIFTLEMLIKTLSMGFVLHPDAYLRDGWNVLDFFLVVVSIIALAVDFPGIAALVSLRVLRPLRTVNQIKRLKMLINALVMSIPAVTTNFLFLVYFIFVAGLLGLHLWAGNFSQRCYYPEGSPYAASTIAAAAAQEEQDSLNRVVEAVHNGAIRGPSTRENASSTTNTSERIVSDVIVEDMPSALASAATLAPPLDLNATNATNVTNGTETASPQLTGPLTLGQLETVCGPQFTCPHSGTCTRNFTAFRATTPFTFERIQNAMLLVFKSAILDNWTTELVPAVNAGGLWAVLYFVIVTMFAGYMLINVFLAVLMSEYALVTLRLRKRAKEREARKREKLAIARAQSELALMGANGLISPRSGIVSPRAADGISTTAVQPFRSPSQPPIEMAIALPPPPDVAGDDPASRLQGNEHLAISGDGEQAERQAQERRASFVSVSVPPVFQEDNSENKPLEFDDLDDEPHTAFKKKSSLRRKTMTQEEQLRLEEEAKHRQMLQKVEERDKNVKFLIQGQTAAKGQEFDDDDIDALDKMIHNEVGTTSQFLLAAGFDVGVSEKDDLELFQQLSAVAATLMSEDGSDHSSSDDESINSDDSFENMRLKTNHGRQLYDDSDSDISDLFPTEEEDDEGEKGDGPQVGSSETKYLIPIDAMNNQQQQASAPAVLDDDALPEPTPPPGAHQALTSNGNNSQVSGLSAPPPANRLEQVSRIFTHFMNFITFLTLVAIGVDHFGIEDGLITMLDMFSHFCAPLYVIEFVIKVIAHGFLRTAKDFFNILDLLLVGVSAADFMLTFQGQWAWIRGFRGLRAMRLSWQVPAIHSLMTLMMPAAKPALLILLLLFIILFIYAVIGMQLFGIDQFNVLRVQYGSIWEAALSNFIVVTGDQWGNIVAAGMKINTYASAPFFITLFGIGNFIILNLFVAVIIEQLDILTNVRWNKEKQELVASFKGRDHPPRLILPLMKTRVQRMTNDDYSAFVASASLMTADADKSGSTSSKKSDGGEKVGQPHTKSPTKPHKPISNSWNLDGLVMRKRVIETATNEPRSFWAPNQKKKFRNIVLQGNALFILGPKNAIRRACAAISYSIPFRYVSVIVTILNMLFIAMEGLPLDSLYVDSDLMDTVRGYAELGFVGFYLIEFIVGISARGCFFPKNEIHIMGDGSRLAGRSERPEVIASSYFSDGWNGLNFVITLTAIGGLLLPQYMKTLRALRCLRLVVFVSSLRIIATAILKAVPHMFVSLCLVLTMWFVFGVFGVQTLKGKLYYCTDPGVNEQVACVGYFNQTTFSDTIEIFSERPGNTGVYERQWKSYLLNFDHIGKGMISLMAVALGEDWPAIMFLGSDAPSTPGQARSYYRDPYIALYYVIFVILGNFVSLSLLLGVLINFFIRYKKGADGTMLLTNKQRVYLLTKRIVESTVLGTEIQRPDNCLRLPFFMITTATKSDLCPASQPAKEKEQQDEFTPVVVKGKRRRKKQQQIVQQNFTKNDDGLVLEEKPLFDVFMGVVTLLNGLVLATYSLEMDDFVRFITEDICHLAFIGLFLLEVLIRLIASPKAYFSSYLNRVDFVAVLVMVAGAPYVLESYLGRAAYLARVVKCLGAIKLFTRGETAQKQLLVISSGIPALLNLVLVLFIIFFIFGVTGVDLFQDVKLHGALTELRNFQHLWNAFLILYQTMSTNAWHAYMLACMVEEPNCSEAAGNCGTVLAYPYFVIFVLLTYVIILQLCVAIVVEHFEDIESAGDGVVQSLLELREQWREIGTSTSKALPVETIVYILKRLPKKLTKLEPPVQPKDLFHLLYKMKIPIKKDLTVSYRSTVLAVVRFVYGIDATAMERVSEWFAEDIPDSMHFSVGHLIAARSIWKIWKLKRERLQKAGKLPAHPRVGHQHEPESPHAASEKRLEEQKPRKAPAASSPKSKGKRKNMLLD